MSNLLGRGVPKPAVAVSAADVKATGAAGGTPAPAVTSIANDRPNDRDYDDPYPGGKTAMGAAAAAVPFT